MFKAGLAVLAVAGIATTALTASADAQTRKNRNYYGNNYNYYGDTYRAYGSAQQQWNTGAVRGRYDPNSYDGRRTGQPRTCGHDFFQYDDRGVPTGPYCN
jgi:hypothetical protein